MAIKSKFAVPMGDAFPHGAYVVSEVEVVRDFDKSAPAARCSSSINSAELHDSGADAGDFTSC